ncbi:hypothetical protein ACFLSY_09350 [Bacteroidota bacterium]
MRILCRSLEDKKMVWFESSNQYIQMELPGYEVFDRLNHGISTESVAEWCSRKYDLTNSDSLKFVKEIQHFISITNKSPEPQNSSKNQDANLIPASEQFISKKYYHFAGADFCFYYSHKRIEKMVHPLLSHLEIGPTNSKCHQFQLFRHNDLLYLRTNEKFIDKWSLSKENFFKGKVFLELLNKAYQKEENDWMAVMHGSAISDGKNSIIITGDSGKGKSTALAVLLANGFKFMSDDFVPVEAVSKEAYQFPTAISVKKGAVETLHHIYPELLEAEEFYYEDFDKTVRYLSPHLSKEPSHQSLPVKAIVFVNFEPGAELEISRKPKTKAIQNVITESWLSPRYENAECFLDWAISMSYYQLKYSDNQQMIAAITNLFSDEK